MALTEIEYGALASSDVINNNFQYLDDRISNLSETVTSNSAGVSSNIASINSTISALSEDLNSDIEEINTDLGGVKSNLSEYGYLYVNSYFNGTSWYKEYFSDSEKETRVWLEQGGVCSSNSTTVYLKSFKSTNYTLLLGTHCTYYEGGGISGKTATQFSHRNGKGWGYSVNWYACGK